jgi:uncharacterized membrane protein
MLPSIATIDPQVVHFVVALSLVALLLRLVAFFGPRLRWASYAATLLFVLAAGAAIVAVRSGLDAHGPVERIPGARDAVEEHEDAGELARNVLIGVALLELIALPLAGAKQRWVHVASAIVGVAGAYTVYRAGDLGGDLVYEYAGGVGTRSGQPDHVQNLLVAGLYNMSRVDRARGDSSQAATLVQELERIRPNDPSVHFLRVESMIRDQHDPRAALARLDSIERSGKLDPRMKSQLVYLRADAYALAGQKDSARAVLTALQHEQPQNTRIRAKLDSLR